jgi:hypothetical protein
VHGGGHGHGWPRNRAKNKPDDCRNGQQTAYGGQGLHSSEHERGPLVNQALACLPADDFGQSLRAREGECELGTLAIGKRCQERISATGWAW